MDQRYVYPETSAPTPVPLGRATLVEPAWGSYASPSAAGGRCQGRIPAGTRCLVVGVDRATESPRYTLEWRDEAGRLWTARNVLPRAAIIAPI